MGGVTPQPPSWMGGLAERGPAALTQKGGTTRQPGDPVGLCLGCCCRVGFLFLFFSLFFLFLCFYFQRPGFSLQADTGFRRRHQAAQLFLHQLTPASQSCSPSNTHSLFASYAYVCVTSGFFGRKPGFEEDFSGFQNLSWCRGREYVCSSRTT